MIGLYIAVGVVVFLAAALLVLIFPAPRRHPDRKQLKGLFIAHRGLHDLTENCPENSLAAMALAADSGFAVENDIHLTKDGEVVVFHDDTTDRMCGVSGKIEEMTLKKLKTLRLAGTNEQIPTLRECLDVINGRVPLLIEFKAVGGNCNALCAAADKFLSEYGGKYFIQSFNPMVLKWYRKNRPDICRGQLSCVFDNTKPAYYKLLSCLLSNVIARPDFISYNHKNAKFFFRRICVLLGAASVGWTYKKRERIEQTKTYFSTFIFENFLPEKTVYGDENAKI